MNIKRILSLAIVFGMAFLIAGCNSNVSETVNEKENDNAKQYEKVFKETDVVAHDFMVVKIEQNYPEILKYLSSKGIEELKEKKGYLLESHEYPNRFQELDGKYELKRYDNFYDEEIGDVIYRYSRYNDKDEIINDWILVEENEDGEWKVKSFYGQRPDIINDDNAKSGTILHEMAFEDDEK